MSSLAFLRLRRCVVSGHPWFARVLLPVILSFDELWIGLMDLDAHRKTPTQRARVHHARYEMNNGRTTHVEVRDGAALSRMTR